MNFTNFIRALIGTLVLTWALGAIVLFCLGLILASFNYLFDINYYDPLIESIYSLPVFFRHVSLWLFSLIYILFEFMFLKKSRVILFLNELWTGKID